MTDRKEAADKLVQKARTLLKRPPLPALASLAIPLYQQAIALDPERLEIQLRLAKAYWSLGQSEQARSVCEQVLAQSPNTIAARLLHAVFQFPMLYRDGSEVVASRTAYQNEIAALARDVAGDLSASCQLAAWADQIHPYYLPYQGLNDIDLQRNYGDMMCGVMATAYPNHSRALPSPSEPGERLRIGIVSEHFYAHSNWQAITGGWMEGLDPARFAIHAYSLSKREDECTAKARGLAAHFYSGERSFDEWRQAIVSDRLYALIYPAVGTHSMVTKLAMLRLAPIQCLAAGHCTTSGFPTMDYFLSADLTEPPDAISHYSETLVRLPGLGIRYARPLVSSPSRSRASFGLRPSACVFLSPNALVKYLPQHDALYPSIAAQLEDSQIVFVRHPRRDAISRQFEQRMRRAFAEHEVDWDRHVVFLPRLDRADYNDLQVHSDIYLDSIGWNGGNTTAIALGYDLPMVTLTGPVFRGRMGTAMLRLMGIEETIAATPREYVEIAVRLGKDAEWRQQLRRRIAQGKHRIYDDPDVAAGLAAFLENAIAMARPKHGGCN